MNQAGFYGLWMPALMVSGAAEPVPLDRISFHAAGFEWPVVTMIVAAIGVLAARPLSPRRTPPLSFGRNLLVTLIMLVAAQLWVIDTRPGLLFAFVVALGLGFSGYSLIELMGEQMARYVKEWFAALPLPGRKRAAPLNTDNRDPDEDPA